MVTAQTYIQYCLDRRALQPAARSGVPRLAATSCLVVGTVYVCGDDVGFDAVAVSHRTNNDCRPIRRFRWPVSACTDGRATGLRVRCRRARRPSGRTRPAHGQETQFSQTPSPLSPSSTVRFPDGLERWRTVVRGICRIANVGRTSTRCSSRGSMPLPHRAKQAADRKTGRAYDRFRYE